MVSPSRNAREFHQRLQTEQNFLVGDHVDKISEYIQGAIARQEPLESVLRLICLQSQTAGGMKQKVVWHAFRMTICATVSCNRTNSTSSMSPIW
jgi:hypothetical protein